MHEPLLRIPQFFTFVKNRVTVYAHRLPPQHPHGQGGVREKDPAHELTMDKTWTYEQVTARIGQALGVDPLLLRLTLHNPFSDMPKPSPLKYRGVESLYEMLSSVGTNTKQSDILFYEARPIPWPPRGPHTTLTFATPRPPSCARGALIAVNLP